MSAHRLLFFSPSDFFFCFVLLLALGSRFLLSSISRNRRASFTDALPRSTFATFLSLLFSFRHRLHPAPFVRLSFLFTFFGPLKARWIAIKNKCFQDIRANESKENKKKKKISPDGGSRKAQRASNGGTQMATLL